MRSSVDFSSSSINRYGTISGRRGRFRPQGEPILLAAGKRYGQLKADESPYLDFIPSVYGARATFARLEQHVAVLRVIEALRDYAAYHSGHLPQRLDLITDLPLPDDPVSGKPFVYELKNETASLEPTQIRGRAVAQRYTLEVAR